MRSGWVPAGEMRHILAALTAPNRLACEVSLATGLRIGDVLALKAGAVKKQRFTVQEKKLEKPARFTCRVSCGNVALLGQGRFMCSLGG